MSDYIVVGLILQTLLFVVAAVGLWLRYRKDARERVAKVIANEMHMVTGRLNTIEQDLRELRREVREHSQWHLDQQS